MRTAEEIVAIGQEIYSSKIKPLVEPQMNGQFVVIDIETGEYDVNADELEVGRRLRDLHPANKRFLLRIGYPAAHSIGGNSRPKR